MHGQRQPRPPFPTLAMTAAIIAEGVMSSFSSSFVNLCRGTLKATYLERTGLYRVPLQLGSYLTLGFYWPQCLSCGIGHRHPLTAGETTSETIFVFI